MFDWLASTLGVKSSQLLAGFLGALGSLHFLPKASRIFLCSMVINGAICAAYVTPAIAVYLDVGERLENGIAFTVGLFGMTLTGAVITAIRESKLAESISSWTKRPGA